MEERCWTVLCAVVDMHRYGPPLLEEESQAKSRYRCSARIDTIILAMQCFAIVRADILRRVRIDQLVDVIIGHELLSFMDAY